MTILITIFACFLLIGLTEAGIRAIIYNFNELKRADKSLLYKTQKLFTLLLVVVGLLFFSRIPIFYAAGMFTENGTVTMPMIAQWLFGASYLVTFLMVRLALKAFSDPRKVDQQ